MCLVSNHVFSIVWEEEKNIYVSIVIIFYNLFVETEKRKHLKILKQKRSQILG